MTRTPMPYDVKNSPCQTFVARQYGEAWTRPFAAVFEPFDTAGSQIERVEWLPTPRNSTVTVEVHKRNGRRDRIFSSDEVRTMTIGTTACTARLAVVSDDACFMAQGTELTSDAVQIRCEREATVAVAKRDGVWYYTADAPCRVRIGKRNYRLAAATWQPVEE